VAGDKDHTVPASLVREAAKRQRRSKAITAYKEFPGRIHFTLGQDGWADVADYALTWAMANAAQNGWPLDASPNELVRSSG
jgi:hypothetical protein